MKGLTADVLPTDVVLPVTFNAFLSYAKVYCKPGPCVTYFIASRVKGSLSEEMHRTVWYVTT